MPTNFPGGLDNFTNPTPADDLNTPAVLHTDQHSDINDAVEALETRVGITGSADPASLDFEMANHAHTGADGTTQIDYSDILNTPVIPPGNVPSDTVTAETAYGETPAAGVATTFSRGDHTHGSVDHDSYNNLTDVPTSFPPSAHASTHEDGGSDEIDVTGLSGLLADGQTPLAHASTHEDNGSDEINVGGLSGVLADPQTAIAHNVLSAIHGDTLTDSVVRGDLLVGNATPLWSRLPIGTTGKFLKTDGTDPSWQNVTAGDIGSGAALTKVDDTNVTLTLGGSPTTALLAATSLTLGWTGTLAAARLNANVVQAITNDTNVTGSISAQNLTLGWTGTLAAGRLNANVVQAITNDTNVTGSISAQNLTLGWTGQLAITRGGTGQSTKTAAFDALSPLSTQGDLLFHDGTNNVRLAKNASATRYLANTGTSNNPAWNQVNLANGVTGTLPVANGGSGVTSLSDILGTTNQVSVSGGTARVIGGNVTLSLPQDIDTAATPTFGGLVISGGSANDISFDDTGSKVQLLSGATVVISDSYLNNAGLGLVSEDILLNPSVTQASSRFKVTVTGTGPTSADFTLLQAGSGTGKLTWTGNAEIGGTLGVGPSTVTSGYKIETSESILVNSSTNNSGFVARFTGASSASVGPQNGFVTNDGAAMAANERIGALLFNGYNGSAEVLGAALIAAATETWSGTARGSKITFFTTPNTTTSLTAAMVIEQNQSVTLNGGITMANATNIVLNTSTGTKIGTATNQKLGFFNATPIIQPADAAQAAAPAGGTGTAAGGWDTAANRNAAINTINAMRTALVNLGLIKGSA